LRRLLLIGFSCVLAACATTRAPPLPTGAGWEQRIGELQRSSSWQLDGRAAVAYQGQGWQATLNWRQLGDASEIHLAGPLGVGALVLKRTAAGLSLNGAPPSDAVLPQLQQRLGFELPIDNLKFWLLGVPDPGGAYELTRNAQDRALKLTQAGWTIDYDRYMPVDGDLLPAHLSLSGAGVRVRIAVDRWERK